MRRVAAAALLSLSVFSLTGCGTGTDPVTTQDDVVTGASMDEPNDVTTEVITEAMPTPTSDTNWRDWMDPTMCGLTFDDGDTTAPAKATEITLDCDETDVTFAAVDFQVWEQDSPIMLPGGPGDWHLISYNSAGDGHTVMYGNGAEYDDEGELISETVLCSASTEAGSDQVTVECSVDQGDPVIAVNTVGDDGKMISELTENSAPRESL